MGDAGLTRLRRGEHFLDACGVRLRVVVDYDRDRDREGESPSVPILVLHGFTGSAESMESVSDSLRSRYTVIRLELIGHGGSESPADPKCYAMSACAEQIAEVVRQLGIERPHLLGYSMGGRAAIAAAVANPTCFSSLILIGATAGIADPTLRRARIASDCELADRIESMDLSGLSRFVDEWMALPIFASQARLGREALERMRAQRMRNRPNGLANSLRGMGAGAQSPLFDQLGNFVQPVLLVAGEQDVKFTEIAASLQGSFPNSRREIVSGVGHAVHLEAVAEFGNLVTSFLSSLSRSPTSPPTSRSAKDDGEGASTSEPPRPDCV